ncbi:MAG: cyclic nucleotide-binding domain-containing protein [Acidimicrobiales bacterium]
MTAARLEKHPTGWLTELTASLAVAVSGIGMAIAVAALIFTGDLSPGLPRMTANSILATAIVTGLIGWRSSFVPTVAVIQDAPAVVLVVAAAAIAQSSGSTGPTDAIVFIGLVTLVTGALMVAVARFGVASLVRFLPTTVIGGFVAGTGWLLFKGGIDVALDRSLSAGDVPSLFESQTIRFWLPALLLGVTMQLAAARKSLPPATISLVLLGAVAAFFIVTAVTSSISQVENDGWLIGPFSAGTSFDPISPAELANSNWGSIFSSPGTMLAVVAVSVVALLLNLSGLEAISVDRLDLQAEATTAGVTNILIAPLGSVAAFHALGDTALARQMGARSRMVPLVAAGACVFTVTVGLRLVGLTPRFVAGGLLVAVGLGLLISWFRGLQALSGASERILSILIVVMIGVVGILEGIMFGLIAACIVFVVRYSRIDPIGRESNARDIPSRVDRSPADRQLLADHPDQTAVFQLQGYLFFGSFTKVVERIRTRLAADSPVPAQIIIDFRHVTGIDASGHSLLARLAGEVADAGSELLVSGLDNESPLHFDVAESRFFTTLDLALEHVEEMRLTAARSERGQRASMPLSDQLTSRLTKVSAIPGDRLISQDEVGSSMYVVVTGSVLVTRIDPDGTEHRLRRTGAGTIIGELALLADVRRSAQITADTDVELLVITRVEYQRLRTEHPALALELQDFILRELADRTVSLSQFLSHELR